MTLDKLAAVIACFASIVHIARKGHPVACIIGDAAELEVIVTRFADVDGAGDDEVGVFAVVTVIV